ISISQMEVTVSLKARVSRSILNRINKILPKYRRAVIITFPNAESGAIEVANKINNEYAIPVIYYVNDRSTDYPGGLLHPDITIRNSSGTFISKVRYVFDVM